MKHLLLSLALCISLFSAASAQVLTDNGAKSDAINQKMHEVDMLLQVMPLLLKKEQINKILPVIERNRQDLRKQLSREDEALAKLEPLLDDAIKNAYEKGAYPPRKMTTEVANQTLALSKERSYVVLEMVDKLTEVLKITLDAGQMKALVGSFDPKFINPNIKPADMTDLMKMNFYVERVLLDPTTYEILKKLAKTAG